MNEVQKQRLLDVARACREAPAPERFSMHSFAHRCGTPACAIGNYAARPDLHGGALSIVSNKVCIYGVPFFDVAERYFGIAFNEVDELFEVYGCGQIPKNEDITNIQAAEYIEAFVVSKEKHGHGLRHGS